jgi:hypothetical protein
MQVLIPKHAIATHPIRKTVDGVSKYTQIFVKLNLNDPKHKELSETLKGLVGGEEGNEIRVYDNEKLFYSFDGKVKEVRASDGVFVLEVASGVVQYPRAE